MSKIKLFSKISAIILIVSIFFTACDVPDISEFTTQSAEMTRGIRQGVTDTGSVLETAAANEDLFEAETREAFKQHSKNYNAAMKPTIDTLDALDNYLGALNALAQANKKSGENAKALAGAVNNLVSSASKLVIVPPAAALEIPETALKIGTGILAAAEQFRTAKSFKKRVNAAAEIVEGRFEPVPQTVTKDGKTETVTEQRKICTDDKKTEIENVGKQLMETRKTLKEAIEKEINENPSNANLSKEEKDKLIKNALETRLKAPLEQAEKEAAEKVLAYGCGVIDLLKFTMQDLKRINLEVSGLMQRNFVENNRVTFNLYRGIDENNSRIQREITFILKHKSTLAKIKDDEFNFSASKNPAEKKELEDEILRNKRLVKFNLDSIYMLDGVVKNELIKKISSCDPARMENGKIVEDCSGMKEFIECPDCTNPADRRSREKLQRILDNIETEKFHTGNSHIEEVLNTRTVELFKQNETYLAERARIKPDYDRINSELNAMKTSQKKLDKLLSSSIDALNTWTATHINLRVTVNTKKPLSVGTLAAKVKEIWAAIEPQEAE